MTLGKKGVERKEGITEYVGCQEGEEGPTLTGERAGIRVRPLTDQACACDGVSKNGLKRQTHGQRSGKLARLSIALFLFLLPSPVSSLSLEKQLCLAPWA